MSHAAAHAHAEEYGVHGHKDHGHVIVSIWTLRLVLTTLLFFTLLTVSAARFEEWIAVLFHVEIPQWINAGVALSIAVIKTSLVVLFFMQLKYDNPLNGMIFIFTILTVSFFLGFTTLDLGKRSTLDRFKGHYITPGGIGLKNDNVPITKTALDTAKANENYHQHEVEHAAEPFSHHDRGLIADAGYLPEEFTNPVKGSTPNRSRPVTGLTLPGFAPEQTAEGGHGDEHAKPEPHAAAGEDKK